MRRIALALCVCLLPALVFAQTRVYSLHWDQPLAEGQTFADVQSYIYSLNINGGPAETLVVECVDGAPIRCSAPLPALSGQTTLMLTATNAFGSVSATMSGGPPGGPLNLSVTVTVTVQQ